MDKATYEILYQEQRKTLSENKQLREKIKKLEECLRILNYDITTLHNDMICNCIVNDIGSDYEEH